MVKPLEIVQDEHAAHRSWVLSQECDGLVQLNLAKRQLMNGIDDITPIIGSFLQGAQEVFYCNACFKSGARGKLKRCSRCKTAHFCSRECQQRSHPHHKDMCNPVVREVIDRLTTKKQENAEHVIEAIRIMHGDGYFVLPAPLLEEVRLRVEKGQISTDLEAVEEKFHRENFMFF